MIKKQISFAILLLISITITLYLVFSRANNELIIKNGSSEIRYYIPNTSIEFEEDLSKKYFLLMGAYEKPYLFEHLRFDHWWIRTFGVYFFVENDAISEGIICFEQSIANKTCYLLSEITAEASQNVMRNLHITVETELGIISISIKKLNLADATRSTKIADEYEKFKRL